MIEVPHMKNDQFRALAESAAVEIESADKRLAEIDIELARVRKSTVSASEIVEAAERHIAYCKSKIDEWIGQQIDELAMQAEKPDASSYIEAAISGRTNNGTFAANPELLTLASQQILLESIQRQANKRLKGNLTFDERRVKIEKLSDEQARLRDSRSENISIICQLSGDPNWQPTRTAAPQPFTLDSDNRPVIQFEK